MAPLTPLERYLRAEGMTPAQFARLGPWSPVLIHGWRHGTRRPSVTNALRIEKVTRGAIPVEAWSRSAA